MKLIYYFYWWIFVCLISFHVAVSRFNMFIVFYIYRWYKYYYSNLINQDKKFLQNIIPKSWLFFWIKLYSNICSPYKQQPLCPCKMMYLPRYWMDLILYKYTDDQSIHYDWNRLMFFLLEQKIVINRFN